MRKRALAPLLILALLLLTLGTILVGCTRANVAPAPFMFISSPSGTYASGFPIYLNASAQYLLGGNRTSWMTYSLDGNANVSMSGTSVYLGGGYGSSFFASIVLPPLSEGSHRIIVYAGTYGGPTFLATASFNVDLTPPRIIIFSPENRTYGADAIPLNFSTSEPVSYMEYRLDGVAHVIVSDTVSTKRTSLRELPSGTHCIIAYATDLFGHNSSSETVYFAIDTSKPKIIVMSPENTTYFSSNIPLVFSVDKSLSKASYSLDGNTNITVTENATLSTLAFGQHSITVYANDTLDNDGASKTVFFTVSPNTGTGELSPATLIVAFSGTSLTVIAIALLSHFKKIKRKHSAQTRI